MANHAVRTEEVTIPPRSRIAKHPRGTVQHPRSEAHGTVPPAACWHGLFSLLIEMNTLPNGIVLIARVIFLLVRQVLAFLISFS
jgi:hypothetical protein